jgi:hypothetical protein
LMLAHLRRQSLPRPPEREALISYRYSVIVAVRRAPATF